MPRPETESVLRRALDWVDAAASVSSVAAIVGAPGLGKTMLLRVIESRLAATAADEPARVLYLPYAGLGVVDLAIWVHGLLGRPAPDVSDEGAAIASLRALGDGEHRPFLLLIDDADSMPPETLEALSSGLAAVYSPVRLLLALTADSKATRLLAALHALGPAEFRLVGKLSVDEVGDYLDARMSWANVPPVVRAQVDADLVLRLHSLSGGVPRALQSIAASAFEPADDVSRATVESKWRRETWMGQPIEDDLEV